MTTSSTNYTGLYSGNVSGVIPNTAYGNANVVSLLAVGTDGANTVGNISATGNIAGGNILTPGAVSATGNITTAGYFIGTFLGNISGNLTVPGANTQVIFNNAGNAGASSGLTFNTTGNILSATGNIIGGNLTTAGNATAQFFIGNGSQLTGIGASYSNASVSNFLANGFGSNTIVTTGNITGGYFLGNGSQLTGLPATYGNANVVANLAALGTNPVSTTGNISAGYFVGNGSQLTGVVAASIGTLASLSVTGNTQTGNLLTGGVVSATGNITGSYIFGNGSQLTGLPIQPGTYGNANVVANLAALGSNPVSTTGNITGAYIFGNGSQLTGLPATYGNANVVANLAALGTNPVSTTGNITASYFIGNGSLLTDINAGNIVGSYGNAQVASFLNAFGSNTITTTGNITAGNITTTRISPTTGSYVFVDGISMGGGNIILGNGIIATQSLQSNIIGSNTSITAGTTITAGGNVIGGNLLTAGQVSATGNITGAYIFGNGSQLTGLPASYSNANVTTLLAAFGSNTISTTGNITAGYFVGNGSLLTSITGGNVTGTVANATYALNSNAATYASVATFADTANAVAGANVSGTVANATYALNSNAATFAGTVTTNAQPNITSVGILTAVNTSGAVSATGNITGAYIFGNGSQLTGLPAGYSNADVTTLLAAFGSNSISTTGNITAGYFVGNGSLLTSITGANVTGTVANATYATNAGTATFAGTANSVAGANVSGTVANATYATTAGSAGTANTAQYVTANAQANITSVGTLTTVSVSGNTTTGNLLTAGVISATGNITGGNLLTGGASGNIVGADYVTANYFVGNGYYLSGLAAVSSNSALALINGTTNLTTANGGNANLTIGGTSNVVVWTTTGQSVTGLISASGNVTGGNVLTGGVISATSNITGGNILTGGLVSATGNITGANIIAAGLICATGNITTGQSTIIGTANTTGGAGNIILSGKNIATDMIRNPDSSTGTTADLARIVIGTGFNGNVSVGSTPQNGGTQGSRLYIGDAFNRGNSAIQARTVYISDFTTLTANVTNQGMRINGLTVQPVIGGGSTGNTITGTVFTIAGIATIPTIGGGLTGNLTSLGNTTAQYVVAMFAGVTTQAGSNTGNSIGYLTQMGATSSGSNFANTMIGVSHNATGNITPTTYIGYHMPSNVSTYGATLTNQTRAAANYYFLKNDDSAAQAQIGSLRSYSEFNYTNTVTSGAVTIDKTNAQVQQVNLTGNVTSLTYSNFVSSASDGTNTDEQADTVTIIFNQGATGGYSVTFPSGAAYKYAGGINTLVATTANSVSLVAITAIRISGTTTYLTTISPAFT